MTVVQPPAMRHQADYFGNYLAVTMPSHRQWYQILFLCLWLCGWAVGELSTISELLLSQNSIQEFDRFMLLWLIGWTLGGLFAISTLLWQLAGKEVVEINGLGIKLSRRVWGVGWSQQYAAADIEDLRVSPQPATHYRRSRSLYYWGSNEGVIAFDYGAKTIRFGGGVEEAEAKQIVKTIQQHFSIYK